MAVAMAVKLVDNLVVAMAVKLGALLAVAMADQWELQSASTV